MLFPGSFLWSAIVSLILMVGVSSEAQESSRQTFALGRNLETSLLDEALHVSPQDLIPFIESRGLKVYLYPSRAKRNPDFVNGKMISDELRDERMIRDIFEDSGGGATLADRGVFIPKEDTDLGKYGTFIVIAESANSYTLLHEFTHFLFHTTELPNRASEKIQLQDRAFLVRRNLGLQFGYGLRNFEKSDVYKRENLLSALLEDLDVETQRVRLFASEEVIVESLLLARIRPTSPYYKEKRVESGRWYANDNIRSARVEVSRSMHLWDELRLSYLRTAGAYPHTSHAEREEIVSSIPIYHATVKAKADQIESELKLLEALIP